ncbi:MAG TPA: DUF2520 domain-containing protein [Prevotellaceae bacterium]|nr:DUF2520 domain-containing protein [Prevotellaceae bacterium]HBE54608.1 DUF2520 domain-containing protein [Prevotellaceae bacterium]
MGPRAYRAVLIGRGNVATRLGQALRGAGHEVIAVGGRTRVAPVPQDADIYIIAVSDRCIPQVAAELASVQGLVVHTAGSVPMDVLPQRRRGVLYPLQTLSRARQIDFARVPLFIESDSDLPLLREVASSVSGSVRVLDSARRRSIHLAAVFCSNFTNAMYSMAYRLLRREGIPFEALLPLIDETAAKVHDLVPHEAQTGPAVRWDTEVMDAQRALLPDEEMRQVYTLLSNYIHNDKLRFKENQGTAL